MAVFKRTEFQERVGSGQSAPTGVNHPSDSKIGKTVSINGEVTSEEEVYIEGKVEGNINVKNRVVIGKSGVVNAEIKADEIIIEGTVNGNVHGGSKVLIVPEGILNGNIVAPRVKLSDGAIFKGNIDMTIPDDKKEYKEPEKKEDPPQDTIPEKKTT